MVVLVRRTIMNPNTLAATTSAASSGDSASYRIWSGSGGPAGQRIQCARIVHACRHACMRLSTKVPSGSSV